VLPQLNATSLGALLACYEHATFTAATVLGINPFDQFGVELGKVLAASAEQAFEGQAAAELDPATNALIARLR
jgi:glucose-6-phosphate isomerase